MMKYHNLCPMGLDTWCSYNKATALNRTYSYGHGLPHEIVTIKKNY